MTVTSRRLFWIVGLWLFVSYTFFYQAGGWNQNSRFALVRAILEHQSLQIDAYHLHTGDIAVLDGHYYSDKAPGTSLVALPPSFLARLVSTAAGVDPTSFSGIAWTSYVATVATSGLFTLVAALCVLWICLRWGGSPAGAVFAASAYGVATPAWCYATLFMGHGLAAGCLMLAFASAIGVRDAGPGDRQRLAWTIGLSGGWAVVSEFPAAVPLALIVALAWLNARESVRAPLFPVLLRIIVGGSLAAAALMVYNTAAFGSPLHIGYASEQGFEQLRGGFFGINYPQWWRVREILVGEYRGLLPLAPLAGLAPIGLALLAAAPEGRRGALTAALIVLFYLGLNASYYYWEGGWAYGPRQIMPALPFLALGLAPLWDFGRSAVRLLLGAAWLWGAALTLIAVATTPQPPSTVHAPVRDLLWPAFRDGDLSLNNQGFTAYRAQPDRLRGHPELHAAWNLGQVAGLRGLTSLAPLAAVWVSAIAGLFLTLRRPPASR